MKWSFNLFKRFHEQSAQIIKKINNKKNGYDFEMAQTSEHSYKYLGCTCTSLNAVTESFLFGCY